MTIEKVYVSSDTYNKLLALAKEYNMSFDNLIDKLISDHNWLKSINETFKKGLIS